MIGVNILLVYDDDFIEMLLSHYDIGIIAVGNDVFHTYPVIAIVFYLLLNVGLVYYSVSRCLQFSRSGAWKALVYAYQLVLGPLLVFGIYLVTITALGYTIGEIYETDIEWWVVLLSIIGLSLIINGIVLLIMTCMCGLGESSVVDDYAERRSDNDFEMIYEYSVATTRYAKLS